jgi:hypothetical protein
VVRGHTNRGEARGKGRAGGGGDVRQENRPGTSDIYYQPAQSRSYRPARLN